MEGILSTLKHLGFAQMILAWLFIGCYALAVGGMLGGTGSARSGVVAAIAAIAFALLSDQWVHGALLILFAVGGVGVFVVVAWMLATTSTWLVGANAAQHPRPQPVVVQAQPQLPAGPVAAPSKLSLAEGLRALARSLHLSP